MIVQAMEMLTIHLAWKSKEFNIMPDTPDPSPEDVRLQERIQEQRDSLLEKLLEYAVGTQSNTVECVARSVCRFFLFSRFLAYSIIRRSSVS